MVKKISLFVTCICFQLSIQASSFSIDINIKGERTKYLVLSYVNFYGINIDDTSYNNNGLCHFSGSIHEPQKVSIKSNLAGRSVEDKNSLDFFMENTEMHITLLEDAFPD
ncbi:MAG: DUF4369 domain-containing protein, partial [Bacteroidetes bacterium]